MNKLIVLLLFFATSVSAIQSTKNTYRLWQEFQQKPIDAVLQAPYDHCFERAAQRYRLPKSLLLAVARGESDFEARAVSKSDAQGIMQINPITAKHLGIKEKHLFSPCKNIDAGSRYLKELQGKYNNWFLTLAAYNYGPGRIDKNQHFSELPQGAQWYAAYIYDHLTFVTTAKHINYGKVKQFKVITYNSAYHAKGYIQWLRKTMPDLKFSWFKRPFNKFEVVVIVGSEFQRRRAARVLKNFGINI